MPEQADTARSRLVKTLDDRCASIEAYVREKAPASTRLSTITIVSSALAAALTAGPAIGGTGFTQTVQGGLPIDSAQGIWQPLCIGAFVVSVTAAIAANLAKTHDLTSRIATAEAAGAALRGLKTRVEFGRLPIKDAAQEYRDVIAGIAFVPETPVAGRRRGRGAARGPATLLSPLAIAVAGLAALLLLGTLIGYVIGLTRSSDVSEGSSGQTSSTPAATEGGSTAPAATPSTSNAPSTESSAAAVTGVFAGKVEEWDATVDIVVTDAGVRAYLCDGKQLEAWLNGRRVGSDQFELTSERGTLTGSIEDGNTLFGQFSLADRPAVQFTADRADGTDAGIYRAEVPADGRLVVFGWAVLPDGQQVGIEQNGGSLSEAPELDLGNRTFMWRGAEHTAQRFPA
jgi:hypothetical protein